MDGVSEMPDTNGRAWARVNSLKAGDLVELDGGFTCNLEGTRRKVLLDEGGLFIRCAGSYECDEAPKTFREKHYLDGQIGYTPETEGEYVGVYLIRAGLVR